MKRDSLSFVCSIFLKCTEFTDGTNACYVQLHIQTQTVYWVVFCVWVCMHSRGMITLISKCTRLGTSTQAKTIFAFIFHSFLCHTLPSSVCYPNGASYGSICDFWVSYLSQAQTETYHFAKVATGKRLTGCASNIISPF